MFDYFLYVLSVVNRLRALNHFTISRLVLSVVLTVLINAQTIKSNCLMIDLIMINTTTIITTVCYAIMLYTVCDTVNA